MGGPGAARRPLSEEEPAPRRGWVAPHIAAEFPGLGIAWVELDARPGKSPEPVRQRLRELSDRFFGAQAIHMRERPIPWAYRVFFRQIGLDPDRTRTPVEQLALNRLHDGAFKSEGLPADALTVAIVETGVALLALDADRLGGDLCIRDSAPGESLPGRPGELTQGTLTIADERGPVSLLFGAGGEGFAVEPDSRRVAVVAVQVKGVPEIAVEEALWMAATTHAVGSGRPQTDS
jgi:DNA/RNA-binding domain of Phe-tRNA-synthetase-like protein